MRFHSEIINRQFIFCVLFHAYLSSAGHVSKFEDTTTELNYPNEGTPLSWKNQLIRPDQTLKLHQQSESDNVVEPSNGSNAWDNALDRWKRGTLTGSGSSGTKSKVKSAAAKGGKKLLKIATKQIKKKIAGKKNKNKYGNRQPSYNKNYNNYNNNRGSGYSQGSRNHNPQRRSSGSKFPIGAIVGVVFGLVVVVIVIGVLFFLYKSGKLNCGGGGGGGNGAV